MLVSIGDRFRIRYPLHGVERNDGMSMHVTIPKSSLVVAEELHDADRLISVSWNNKHVLVLVNDLIINSARY